MKENSIEIKVQVINACFEIINQKKEDFQKEMEETQHEANQFKGAMESRYDTFKEELQDRKNNLAIQYKKLDDLLLLLQSIQPRIHIKIGQGSIVIAQDESGHIFNYFIFSNLISKPLEINGQYYYLLNLESPLGEMLNGKSKNNSFSFRGKKIKILDIY
jgi:hypothetical protein